ncbi:type II toxin-antitoxin system VapC family toxin [Tsukamurella ocularis]|uniref:type II toxin-antitoxin system VapC family toxin n=1 Tax=Tsukamurella ocularis TaxID=1970234 RepID=UPI002168914C|nr:type II toxin-antitoxin system VapC family toxin [Tsukamurella ocularis]MCS3781338.1 PIN domain nuclease of toxin-antitoxin system [Tsukamurella ocularis]MCS3787709.1 PIN domain nuclease of toxin-antitoxin system [Tsukamurella ocularis]MCS3851004.1 PIN domain nuclease of toxin-antitoxin system [Tsukamurella ocularis]
MRLLADTHVLLWWLGSDPRLRPDHRSLIEDDENTVLVSAATVAEVSIKASLGKLVAPEMSEEFLTAQGFSLLPLSVRHAQAIRDLPWHHRDPFDRMLVAQCVVEQVPILTVDERIRAYAIEAR